MQRWRLQKGAQEPRTVSGEEAAKPRLLRARLLRISGREQDNLDYTGIDGGAQSEGQVTSYRRLGNPRSD
jgi:hypothetical protein